MVYRHEVLWGLDFASLAYQDYRVEIDEGNFLSNRIANRQAGDMLRSVEDELGSINFRPLSYQDLGLASSDFIPNPQGSDFLYNNRSDYAFSAKSDDGSSLAIGFRGTDSVSDTWSNISGGLVDWLTVAERFEPLVNASISYALESDVDTVYFFGHSRGGAVAEWYYTSRAPMAAEYGLEFKGVAFASPGIQISQPGIENGFYSYERSADWVANITPFDVNSVTEVTLETRYLDIPFPPAPGTPLDALRLHALLQNHSLKNYATDIVSEGLLPPEEAPDLTAKNLFFYDPVDLSPGQVVDLEWSIGNAGGYFLGQTETRIFLSPEPYYTDQAIDLLSYNVNGMSPGRGLNHGGRVTLPEHLEPGEYHLLAGINIEGAVDELKYENNFTNSISFTVEDTAPAPAPIANDRNFSMDQGGTLTVSLLELTSNDFVPEGSSITVRELFAASTGQVRIEHGNAVFVPEADFTGTASFRYRIDDGQGNVDTATISVIVRSEPTVSPPPPPPEIGADLLPVATEVSPGTRVSVFDLFTVNAGSFDSYDEYWVVLDTRGSADGQLVDRRGNLVGEVQSNGQIHGFVFSEAGISRWAQKGSSDPAWWDFFGSAWPQNPDDLYIQAGNSYSDIIIVPLRLPESPSQQSEMFLEQRLRTFIDIDLPPAQPPTLSLTSANFDGASEKLFVDLVATDTANRGLLVELQLNAAASSLTLDGQLLEAGGSLLLSISSLRDGVALTGVNHGETLAFRLRVDDGQLTSDWVDFPVQIDIPNRPAVIYGGTGGVVLEDSVDAQAIQGRLFIADPDAGEDRFAEVDPAALAGDYGAFAFDPETGVWSYTLDNDLAAVQALPEGTEVTDSLTVTSLDGTASETITVTIRGVNDPATISGTRNLALDLGSGEWDHPAPSTEFTLLSEDRFPVSSDFNAIIQQELGPQAQLADWVDIKARYEFEGGGFLREAGLVPRDEDGINGGAVTRDGARFLSGDRHYLISWGEVHSGFWSHDIAWHDGAPLHLGSWYTDQRLIAFSGEQEPSDGQLPGLASVSGQLLVIDPDAGENRFRPVDPDALLGEFGTFSFNPETGAWSYVLDVVAIGADTSSLNGAVETLTVTSLDGTASETVTVDLIAAEPTENTPASIAGDSTGLVVEDDADRAQASGVLSVTDPDAGEDRFAEVDPATLAGDYGSFAFDPETGDWSYTLDNDLAAVQALPEGAEVTDSLSVISFDGTASETITVTIRGVNDPASISGDTTGLVIEDNPEAQLASGRLIVTDPDEREDRFRPIGWDREQPTDDPWDQPIVPLPMPHALLSAIPQTAQTGELIDVTDLFEAHYDDFDAFRVRLSGPSYDRLVDEDGNTVGVLEGDVQIASVFSGPNALVFHDLSPRDPFWNDIPKPLDEGMLFLDIADGRADIRIEPLILNAAASEIWSPPDGVEPFIGEPTTVRLEVPGSDLFDAEEPELQGDFGVFTFDADTGNWTYRLDNAAYAVQSLPEGAEVTDSLIVTSLDGTASETITVTIRGVNDPASIAGDSTGLVIEDDADRQQASGVLTVTDPDAGEDRFADVDPAALAGDYGAFAFNPESGAWSYTLDNDLDAVQALPEGAEATDILTVTSLDGTATETITVTITGTGPRGDFAPATVSGSVHDRWGNPISDAAVQFVPEAANLESSASAGDQEGPGVTLSGDARMGIVHTREATNQNGHFTFELDRGSSGDIDLIRDYDSDRDGGPSLRDALDVLRLSMGLSVSGRETEALDFIAADVNQDGVIDAQDATAVLRAALGLETDYGPRWIFIDDTADLSGLNRNNSTIETGFRVDEINSDIADLAMTGILLGTMQEYA